MTGRIEHRCSHLVNILVLKTNLNKLTGKPMLWGNSCSSLCLFSEVDQITHECTLLTYPNVTYVMVSDDISSITSTGN